MQATARLEKNTGHVETRGYANSQSVAEDLQSNVVKILSTVGAFAALKKKWKGCDVGTCMLGR
jgi:hypothetical protein